MSALDLALPTCRQTLAEAAQILARAGVDSAALDARLLLMEAMGLSLEALVSAPERRLSRAERARFAQMLARRGAREPLAYILGRRAFWSFDLVVNDAVLVPRPESETVVNAILEAVAASGRGTDAPFRILDLGTGSGCLLFALLSELPQAWGLGVDASNRALCVARDNAARLGLAARSALLRGDWLAGLDGRFDIVVCNAPYIPTRDIDGLAPEIRLHEPRLALDGGADGLGAYRKIVGGLGKIVANNGLVALEVGDGQARAVENLLEAAGFCEIVHKPDLAGKPRVAVARPFARV
jgi:release factor glutamine methyltransferase